MLEVGLRVEDRTLYRKTIENRDDFHASRDPHALNLSDGRRR